MRRLITFLIIPLLLAFPVPGFAQDEEDEDLSVLFGEEIEDESIVHNSPTAPPGANNIIAPGTPALPPQSRVSAPAEGTGQGATVSAEDRVLPESQDATPREDEATVLPQTLPPLNRDDLENLNQAGTQEERVIQVGGNESGENEAVGSDAEGSDNVDLLIPESRRVTGTVVEPPPPTWKQSSKEPSGNSEGTGPIPDFDTSNTHWQSLEVGTFIRPSGGNTPVIMAQGTASPEQPTRPMVNPPIAPSATPAEDDDSERSQLRGLFSDMLPDIGVNDAEADRPLMEMGADTPTDKPSQENASSVTGSLNSLMEDQRTLEGPSAATPPAVASPQAPASPTPPPAVIASPAAPPAVETPPADEPLSPLLPPPLSTNQSRESTAQNSVLPPISEPKSVDLNGGLAIGKSGYLLAEDGPDPQFNAGQAQILTQPDAKPTRGTSPSASPNARANRDSSNQRASVNNPRGTNTGRQNQEASSNNTPKASKPKAANVKPNLSVILVNESGVAGAQDTYRQVLSQLGYTVIAANQGTYSSQSRKTTIVYQSGKDAQARALAKRIPGATELIASKDPLPAEAIVTIR
jgi:hypothetical protein